MSGKYYTKKVEKLFLQFVKELQDRQILLSDVKPNELDQNLTKRLRKAAYDTLHVNNSVK